MTGEASMSNLPCNPLRIAALSAIVLVALLVPASGAFASTMSESGTTVTWSAAGGIDNNPLLTENAGNEELTLTTSDDPVESNHSTGAITADCDDIDGNIADDAAMVLCTDVDVVVVNSKGGDDIVDAIGLDTIVATMNADLGEDILYGGAAPAGDTLNGNDGQDELYGNDGSDDLNGGSDDDSLYGDDGNDTLRGGPSDDGLFPGNGDDNSDGEGGNDYTEEHDDGDIDHSRGGEGLDDLYYNATDFGGSDNDDVDINEDSQTDDGDTEDDPENRFDEFENVDYDIATDAKAHVLTTGGNDAIDGSNEVDVLTPRAGVDRLEMRDNDDTANTVDGYPDVVNCGAGDDIANADQFDELNSCEDVNITEVESAFDEPTPDDAPPTVAFRNLAPNVFIDPIGTHLGANASDDNGVALVVFFDDTERVCDDATPPYTCEWEPTSDDVGGNTLTVFAVDTAGQFAADIRNVIVGKFDPDGLDTMATKRDLKGPSRTRVQGVLEIPAGVIADQGCEGDVKVRIFDGNDRLRKRRVPVQEDCTYSHKFRLPGVAKIEHERVKIKSKFLGNDVLQKETADVVKTKVQDL
jgi:hypothetical protein